jgi:calcineurin-like phosphoesterase
MTEETKSKGSAPDYKGEGVAIWIKTAKNGNKYLSINVLGSIHLTAFKNEPKKEETKIIKEAGYKEDVVNDLL